MGTLALVGTGTMGSPIGPANFHATLLRPEAGARVEVPELRPRRDGQA